MRELSVSQAQLDALRHGQGFGLCLVPSGLTEMFSGAPGIVERLSR